MLLSFPSAHLPYVRSPDREPHLIPVRHRVAQQRRISYNANFQSITRWQFAPGLFHSGATLHWIANFQRHAIDKFYRLAGRRRQ